MKRQGRQAESFCEAPDPASAAVLIFGKPGAPLDEFVDLLRGNWLKSAKDSLDSRRMSPEDAKQNPGLISDNLFSTSLFGGASLIETHIQRENEAAPFLEALAEIEARNEMPPGRLLLIAGDLGPKSKLRGAFEKAKRATALQFFERSSRDFEAWVRTQVSAEKIKLEPEAEERLIHILLDDQSLARSEIEKLATYAADAEAPITAAQIRDLIALEDQSSHFELIDFALDGRPKTLAEHLPNLDGGSAAIPILIGLTRQLQRLSQAHALSASGINGPAIGEKLAPRIYERQWPDFDRRMRRWSPPLVLALLNRIAEVNMACRRAGSPQEALVSRLLMDIAQAAASRKK